MLRRPGRNRGNCRGPNPVAGGIPSSPEKPGEWALVAQSEWKSSGPSGAHEDIPYRVLQFSPRSDPGGRSIVEAFLGGELEGEVYGIVE